MPKRKTSPKRKATSKRKKFSLLRFAVKWGFILGIWAACGLGIVMLYYAHDLPDITDLENKRTPSVTLVSHAETGAEVVLAQYGDLYGEHVNATDLPPHVVQAILATEDRRFYDHGGVDFFGMLRAMIINLQAGGVVQGGSTITQQLAKNLFLSPDRTIKRKIQEMFLAWELEKQFTKNQILTLYLNRVYLGAGNYGIDAAAQFYFGKHADKLDLYEGALIAGLLKAPSRYSPSNDADLADDRARQVLINMEDAGYITEKEANKAHGTAYTVNPYIKGILDNPYFRDWVMEQLPDYIGDIQDDITVVTTLDPGLQSLAEETVAQKVAEAEKKSKVSQGAMVILSPDGAIRAMVGGTDYRKSQFNRAVRGNRQPGSSFKTLVYLTAMERGFTPNDVMVDEPFKVKGWKPLNYKNEYLGEMTLRDAFALSINTIAVKLAKEVGIENVVATARRVGITSDLNYDLTLALGTAQVSLLEMTQAYAHLANEGNALWAYGIIEIRDKNGDILYERQPSEETRVISKRTVAYMNDLLSSVIEYGTGKAATIGRPAAGKTGTSQDYRDAWFIGYTPDYVGGVWVGNDDNTPMKQVTGGSIPARIWHDVMIRAHARKDIQELPMDGEEIFDPGESRSVWDSIVNSFGRNDDSEPEYDYPGHRIRRGDSTY
jgi:penicillin-binding protein 1A